MHSKDHNDLILDDDADDNVGFENEMIKKRKFEKERQSDRETHHFTSPTNQKPTMKIKLCIKRTVQVAFHQKQLLSDYSPQKQSNCNIINTPIERTTQNPIVVRPMQKETHNIKSMEMKFEASKTKYEKRLAEQRKAKRKTIMVNFHDMPKSAKDPRAPKRHCWNRK
ncbi:hypothetical protein MTR67_004245 [Solanum verrucosum]|uniref:Uncharacterized protein n=1 Tax=Solanum verrucosum TaxID=315347 RepID=A0AAF0PX91_SOLVR|nr:hypothetical protein MTR67_004245 [Solanum verrucosum]